MVLRKQVVSFVLCLVTVGAFTASSILADGTTQQPITDPDAKVPKFGSDITLKDAFGQRLTLAGRSAVIRIYPNITSARYLQIGFAKVQEVKADGTPQPFHRILFLAARRPILVTGNETVDGVFRKYVRITVPMSNFGDDFQEACSIGSRRLMAGSTGLADQQHADQATARRALLDTTSVNADSQQFLGEQDGLSDTFADHASSSRSLLETFEMEDMYGLADWHADRVSNRRSLLENTDADSVAAEAAAIATGKYIRATFYYGFSGNATFVYGKDPDTGVNNTITIPRKGFKFNLEVKNWPFCSPSNRLNVTLAVITKTSVSPALEDKNFNNTSTDSDVAVNVNGNSTRQAFLKRLILALGEGYEGRAIFPNYAYDKIDGTNRTDVIVEKELGTVSRIRMSFAATDSLYYDPILQAEYTGIADNNPANNAEGGHASIPAAQGVSMLLACMLGLLFLL